MAISTSVTRERLTQIERFETELKSLGLNQVRVRWHDKIARIDVELQDILRVVDSDNRNRILEMGRSCGFQFITLDLAGYRTGSLNELLTGRNLKLV